MVAAGSGDVDRPRFLFCDVTISFLSHTLQDVTFLPFWIFYISFHSLLLFLFSILIVAIYVHLYDSHTLCMVTPARYRAYAHSHGMVTDIHISH